MANVAPPPSLLQEAKGLPLKKRFSQNFLIDQPTIDAIAVAAQSQLVKHPSSTLVEIGPGAGFLTRKLLTLNAPTHLIEVDPDMVGILRPLIEGTSVQLIHRNVMGVDLMPLLSPSGGVVVGNLPYHLTGPIIFKLIGEMADATYPLRSVMKAAILMVQKEVAQRLVADEGSKAYGQLSIQVQMWCDVQPVISVPKHAFYPAPKVDSAVVMLIPRHEPRLTDVCLMDVNRLVKSCFMHRRKTMTNSLIGLGLGDRATIQNMLESVGISPMARPEQVSIAQWGALTHVAYPRS